MASEDEREMEDDRSKAQWRQFELRYKNLLSISKAQKVHLTTLLIEMTLLWTWYLSGSRDVSVQGVSLSAEGVWLVAPAVLTFFTLVLIGSINAALPANHQLQEIAKETINLSLPCGVAFYDLDTDKNVLDYLTFLKVSTTDNQFSRDPKHSFRHFLYPAVLLCSVATTWFSLYHVPRTYVGISYSVVCVIAELLFIPRPIARAVRRFRGDPTMDQVPAAQP
jgi:hypothetical protein